MKISRNRLPAAAPRLRNTPHAPALRGESSVTTMRASTSAGALMRAPERRVLRERITWPLDHFGFPDLEFVAVPNILKDPEITKSKWQEFFGSDPDHQYAAVAAQQLCRINNLDPVYMFVRKKDGKDLIYAASGFVANFDQGIFTAGKLRQLRDLTRDGFDLLQALFPLERFWNDSAAGRMITSELGNEYRQFFVGWTTMANRGLISMRPGYEYRTDTAKNQVLDPADAARLFNAFTACVEKIGFDRGAADADAVVFANHMENSVSDRGYLTDYPNASSLVVAHNLYDIRNPGSDDSILQQRGYVRVPGLCYSGERLTGYGMNPTSWLRARQIPHVKVGSSLALDPVRVEYPFSAIFQCIEQSRGTWRTTLNDVFGFNTHVEQHMASLHVYRQKEGPAGAKVRTWFERFNFKDPASVAAFEKELWLTFGLYFGDKPPAIERPADYRDAHGVEPLAARPMTPTNVMDLLALDPKSPDTYRLLAPVIAQKVQGRVLELTLAVKNARGGERDGALKALSNFLGALRIDSAMWSHILGAMEAVPAAAAPEAPSAPLAQVIGEFGAAPKSADGTTEAPKADAKGGGGKKDKKPAAKGEANSAAFGIDETLAPLLTLLQSRTGEFAQLAREIDTGIAKIEKTFRSRNKSEPLPEDKDEYSRLTLIRNRLTQLCRLQIRNQLQTLIAAQADESAMRAQIATTFEPQKPFNPNSPLDLAVITHDGMLQNARRDINANDLNPNNAHQAGFFAWTYLQILRRLGFFNNRIPMDQYNWAWLYSLDPVKLRNLFLTFPFYKSDRWVMKVQTLGLQFDRPRKATDIFPGLELNAAGVYDNLKKKFWKGDGDVPGARSLVTDDLIEQIAQKVRAQIEPADKLREEADLLLDRADELHYQRDQLGGDPAHAAQVEEIGGQIATLREQAASKHQEAKAELDKILKKTKPGNNRPDIDEIFAGFFEGNGEQRGFQDEIDHRLEERAKQIHVAAQDERRQQWFDMVPQRPDLLLALSRHFREEHQNRQGSQPQFIPRMIIDEIDTLRRNPPKEFMDQGRVRFELMPTFPSDHQAMIPGGALFGNIRGKAAWGEGGIAWDTNHQQSLWTAYHDHSERVKVRGDFVEYINANCGRIFEAPEGRDANGDFWMFNTFQLLGMFDGDRLGGINTLLFTDPAKRSFAGAPTGAPQKIGLDGFHFKPYDNLAARACLVGTALGLSMLMISQTKEGAKAEMGFHAYQTWNYTKYRNPAIAALMRRVAIDVTAKLHTPERPSLALYPDTHRHRLYFVNGETDETSYLGMGL